MENNILYKVGDQTAVEFYQHYLGEKIEGPLGDYPLAIFEDDDSEDFYLRSSTGANREDGSISFAGDINSNTRVQITHTTRDRVIEASEKSISQSLQNYPGDQPEIALCFSCASRKQVLGTRTAEEIALLQKTRPDLKIAGFYVYGEISPSRKQQPSRFHNTTFVSLLLGVR